MAHEGGKAGSSPTKEYVSGILSYKKITPVYNTYVPGRAYIMIKTDI